MRSLIDLPLFGLSDFPVFETRNYDDGRVRIDVKPGYCGLATIWDKNLLTYAFQMMQAQEGAFGSVISLPPDHLFQNCVFSSIDQSAHGLGDALERLRSTSIRTIVKNKRGERERRCFSWIHAANMRTRVEGERTIVEIIKIELVDWVWQPIFEGDPTFQTSPGTFAITSGDRRA